MSIKEHEFYDKDLSVENNGSEYIFIKNLDGYFWLHKKDIIALAKHFKLTADDLNTH